MLDFEEICCECGKPATHGFFFHEQSYSVCGHEHFLIALGRERPKAVVLKKLLSQVKDQTSAFVLHYKDNHMTITSQIVENQKPVGPETHRHAVQSIIVVTGKVEVAVGSISHTLESNDVIVVPMNTKHTITNKEKEPAKILSYYAFPSGKYSPH